jgi:hypothetical protein
MATPETSTTAILDDPWGPWRRRVEASRRMREDRTSLWQQNVEKRKAGKGDESTEQHVSINQDWPLTKAKIAQIYSQTPEVRLTPRQPVFGPAVPVFGRLLNDAISDANIGATIEENLADVVNAAGIGGSLVSCEIRTEPREVPRVDPLIAGMSGQPVEMMTIEAPVDKQFRGERISPTDLLIPSDFTGSDYDQARWLGREGRMTWAEAQRTLGLTEEQRPDVLSGDRRASNTTTTLNTDTNKFRDQDMVTFQEVFYWRHFYHPEESRFAALQRLVFVDGLDAPVIDEPYRGQKRLQDGTVVGVRRNPIQILTLTYISDEALPPSDSTIGRFQVDELEQSRDGIVQQRKHSIPIRWGDVNRISKTTRDKIDEGEWQSFIWVNGPGDRAIGEVARASYPAERFEFDRVIKGDLSEIWQVGTNQAGAFATGERSASEARIIQQNFQTRVGQERDKVTKYFLRIAEVLAGHLALYGEFELPAGIPREAIANGFVYSVRADATVRQDAQQRIEQLQQFINLTGQSGYINPKPVIEEIAQLSGIDSTTVVIDPQPKPPEPVSVSVSKAEDLINPMFVALLLRTGQAPTPEDVAAAKKLLTAAGAPDAPLVPPLDPTDPNAPPPEVATPGISNPDWQAQPRIEKRAQDAA